MVFKLIEPCFNTEKLSCMEESSSPFLLCTLWVGQESKEQAQSFFLGERCCALLWGSRKEMLLLVLPKFIFVSFQVLICVNKN